MAGENMIKLREWQDRLAKNEMPYSEIVKQFDEREKIYTGDSRLRAVVEGDRKRKTPHVRNVVSELIESQVDSSIPQPKVTARRKKDEHLAEIIENMLRNELDRLPMETLVDMMERTVPIQGGGYWLVEWDSSQRSHTTSGELAVSFLHPKQLVPQDGVTTDIADMDYFILKLPVTKAYVLERYGVNVDTDAEEEPETRGLDDNAIEADDMVTQYMGYERNGKGGISLFSWVGDTVLCNLEDYQARRLRHCKVCGAPEPPPGFEPQPGKFTRGGGVLSDIGDLLIDDSEDEGERVTGHVCPVCGSTEFGEADAEYEEIYMPMTLSSGLEIPGATIKLRGTGEVDLAGMEIFEEVAVPTKIPYYKPDIFPVILQRSVSVFGQLLGDSDVDKIKDQQNTLNRLEAKIIDKLIKSGSYVTLPPDASIRRDADDGKTITVSNQAEIGLIKVIDLEGNIQQDMAYDQLVYEQARQIIGITDSFQGRQDRTATSGKAKEFSAAQSAGRLESKRRMKDAAFATLFEVMFKFKLAYADEPRPVVSKDYRGDTVYSEFNRYDFLEVDAVGEYYWNDQFLFSVDSTAPLASNREAMWQETRLNLESGAFGDPRDLSTLILFWSKMQQLHYPGAGETKKYLEDRAEEQQAQAAAMQAANAQAAATGQMPGGAPNMPPGTAMVPGGAQNMQQVPPPAMPTPGGNNQI